MADSSVTVTKRGRPPKGDQPMTAAERKRAQRQRDSRAITDGIGDEQNAPLRALLAILGRVDASEPPGCVHSELGQKSAGGTNS
jgi:hypothetical protein